MHGIDTTFLVQVELREAPNHSQARAWLDRALDGEGPFLALAPQVPTGFVHVVTDAKRFIDTAFDGRRARSGAALVGSAGSAPGAALRGINAPDPKMAAGQSVGSETPPRYAIGRHLRRHGGNLTADRKFG